MNIQFIGHSFFKITSKERIIATDPFPEKIGIKPSRFKADILSISHNHWDHNNKKAILGEPFIVDEPGEYDIDGISILGIRSFHDNKQGEERGLNTIFLFEMEGIKIAHFGDYGQDDLTTVQLESLKEADILLLPVGGVYTIGPKKAHQLILKIEPKIVIPMHYNIPGLKISELSPLSEFLKEIGEEEIKPVEKLSIKKKDLPKETEVIVLKPMGSKK